MRSYLTDALGWSVTGQKTCGRADVRTGVQRHKEEESGIFDLIIVARGSATGASQLTRGLIMCSVVFVGMRPNSVAAIRSERWSSA